MCKLCVDNLSFFYEKGIRLIEQFSLTLQEGEICGLLGASGSGKTTILRLLAGLESPSGGTIKIDDTIIYSDMYNLPPEKRKIGLLFQDYGLFPHMSVEKNISFGLHKYSKQERLEIIEEMLQLIGMSELRKRYPYQLSGGQQQRVALARALAPKPEVLLLDEPFSNLDNDIKGKIRTQMKEILTHTNTTCILCTHDTSDVDYICNRAIKL